MNETIEAILGLTGTVILSYFVANLAIILAMSITHVEGSLWGALFSSDGLFFQVIMTITVWVVVFYLPMEKGE